MFKCSISFLVVLLVVERGTLLRVIPLWGLDLSTIARSHASTVTALVASTRVASASWIIIGVVKTLANLLFRVLIGVISTPSGIRWLFGIVIHGSELSLGIEIFLLLTLERTFASVLWPVVVRINLVLSLLVLNNLHLRGVLEIWCSISLWHLILWTLHFLVFHSASSVWLLLEIVVYIIIDLAVDGLEDSLLIQTVFGLSLWLLLVLRLIQPLAWILLSQTCHLDAADVPSWTHLTVGRHSWFIGLLTSGFKSLTCTKDFGWSVILEVSGGEQVLVFFHGLIHIPITGWWHQCLRLWRSWNILSVYVT